MKNLLNTILAISLAFFITSCEKKENKENAQSSEIETTDSNTTNVTAPESKPTEPVHTETPVKAETSTEAPGQDSTNQNAEEKK